MSPSIVTRVLVVEDNEADQFLLHRELRLTHLGENVLFVSDARQAMDLLQGPNATEFRRHLMAIFLDVHLPHIKGTELLKFIREIKGMEKFPVIVMTSSAQPSVAAACGEYNAMALVEKPMTLARFSKVMADLFHQPMPIGVP